jgi:hypothetical protein
MLENGPKIYGWRATYDPALAKTLIATTIADLVHIVREQSVLDKQSVADPSSWHSQGMTTIRCVTTVSAQVEEKLSPRSFLSCHTWDLILSTARIGRVGGLSIGIQLYIESVMIRLERSKTLSHSA